MFSDRQVTPITGNNSKPGPLLCDLCIFLWTNGGKHRFKVSNIISWTTKLGLRWEKNPPKEKLTKAKLKKKEAKKTNKKKTRSKTCLLMHRFKFVSTCGFSVWLHFSFRLFWSHFLLALFPIFVLNLSVPGCQFVKTPHHYCQKSHCSATTKDSHTISHTLAHTRTYRPLRCWKRVTSSFDTQRQASPSGILNTTREAKWTRKNWSLWFPCKTLLAPWSS